MFHVLNEAAALFCKNTEWYFFGTSLKMVKMKAGLLETKKNSNKKKHLKTSAEQKAKDNNKKIKNKSD